MATTRAADERIGELQTRIDQLRARQRDIRARESARERKADTRRKIIVGGTVLAILRAPDDPRYAAARAVWLEALARATDRDRAVLEAEAAKGDA